MPNQPRTPKRTVRVPDALWVQLITEANDSGTTPSHIIRTLIERHVASGVSEVSMRRVDTSASSTRTTPVEAPTGGHGTGDTP